MTLSVTINAHQLGRLIDKTIGHMGSEYVEPLHGIRLDVDANYLYAVASDRYTMAVARYALTDNEDEPWGRTVPAEYLPALREWISTHQGDQWITVEAGEDRIVFDSARTTYSVALNRGLEFPDWRGILRKLAENTVEGEPFPCLNSSYFARFGATEGILRVRLAGDTKAALLFGENFIGAIMPARYEGLEPTKQQPFPAAVNDWLWTLAAGSKDADMNAMPKPEYPRYEAFTDVQKTGEGLLRSVLQSTSNAVDTSYFDDDSEAWYAHIHASVANWRAFRYLDALAKVDPRIAAQVVADTAEQLDDGALGEWAWDEAEKAGHNPKKWDEEYENALREQAAEKPPLWATRLATGLNAARNAGITFRVEDNPHVRFNEERQEWQAIKPQSAENAA
ncbi:hypothetical protein AB0D42_27755 [Streptomyces sp. NPDC048304]|uniref:DNA polymerase III subunit beta family protein n=1 Tax=Streptomyces sp. NPDC048304 TaxID=3154820 RepID=UPI0033DD204A